ncbi:hypothetical protein HPP92_000627 [Vanilla planifolia]|uniref:Uncharacterized protein n=1 Tax=Vanilla planifolia TaxID=51239 RepID=A0A835RXU2_VANPL|nr:hypothetical protein HPP92_000627 [Vanilla planifolia]
MPSLYLQRHGTSSHSLVRTPLIHPKAISKHDKSLKHRRFPIRFEKAVIEHQLAMRHIEQRWYRSLPAATLVYTNNSTTKSRHNSAFYRGEDWIEHFDRPGDPHPELLHQKDGKGELQAGSHWNRRRESKRPEVDG